MKVITIQKTVSENFNISDADYWVVRQLGFISLMNQITAIKFIRMQYNLGLYEAQRICDAIRDAAE